MKIALAFCSILLFHFCSNAQSAPEERIHIIEDTIRTKSGLYYVKSTDGHYSVLLPVPFRDFTVTAEGVSNYAIRAKSPEGIKFSATEITKKGINKPIDLDSILMEFKGPSNTVNDIRRAQVTDDVSLYFSVANKSSGAFFKYIDTKFSLFVLVIEFPLAYKKMVEEKYAYFFSLFAIIENGESNKK